jgi:hypothetical protein
MALVDWLWFYSPRFALLALVLIIVGVAVLAQGNAVGGVGALLCGLVIGCALWWSKPRVSMRQTKGVHAFDTMRVATEATEATVDGVQSVREDRNMARNSWEPDGGNEFYDYELDDVNL